MSLACFENPICFASSQRHRLNRWLIEGDEEVVEQVKKDDQEKIQNQKTQLTKSQLGTQKVKTKMKSPFCFCFTSNRRFYFNLN